MKATELRIGNYVFHKENILRITNIIDFCVNMEFGEQSGERNNEIDIDEISPILLTEGLLKSCGFFKYAQDFAIISKNGGTIIISESEWYKNKWCIMYNKEKLIDNFVYLHQLQNLYFALTGEELSITL